MGFRGCNAANPGGMFADGHPCCAPQPKLRSKNMYAPFTQLVPNDELTDEVRHAVLCPALLRVAMYAHGPANPASLQALIPALTLILHPRSYPALPCPALPRCLLSWRVRGDPAAWRSSSAAWTSSPSAPCRQAAACLPALLCHPALCPTSACMAGSTVHSCLCRSNLRHPSAHALYPPHLSTPSTPPPVLAGLPQGPGRGAGLPRHPGGLG